MMNYGEKMRELRAERAAAARQLRDQGKSLRQIATELGVDHTLVARDLRGTGPTGDDNNAMNDWLRGRARRNPQTEAFARKLGLTPTPDDDED